MRGGVYLPVSHHEWICDMWAESEYINVLKIIVFWNSCVLVEYNTDCCLPFVFLMCDFIELCVTLLNFETFFYCEMLWNSIQRYSVFGLIQSTDEDWWVLSFTLILYEFGNIVTEVFTIGDQIGVNFFKNKQTTYAIQPNAHFLL